MATSTVNQKVFVSPGVYTSETDLAFVAQSVGVTTLGLVGETLKGPAFEPIFVTNYDEFQAFFGGTEPTKYVNTQIPKYEAAYIAKSYLQQSNQLFVTRILGLSGYDAGPSWSITLKSNVDGTTVGLDTVGSVSWSANFSGNSSLNIVNFVGGSLPPDVIANLTKQYTQQNGSVSTLDQDFDNYLDSIMDSPSLSATTAVVYGPIPETDYNPLASSYSNLQNAYGVENLNLDANDLTAAENDTWYYANFTDYTANNFSGYSFYYEVTSLTSGASNTFTGILSGKYYTFSGTAYPDFNNLVVATVRSRGISEYINPSLHGPKYQVTGLTDVQLLCTGPYSNIASNPYSLFALSGSTYDGNSFQLEISLNENSSTFISKVLGTDNFSKNRTQVPLFVEEVYPKALNYLYNSGLVKGINCSLVALPEARSKNSSSIAWNLEKYTTPKTPFFVSELRGNEVFDLFRLVSVSDGTAANTEIKISIANISFNNNTFDLLVRSFYDTDRNPVVLEKFGGLNLDETSNNFVAKKIGSSDGKYALLSKFIMVEMASEYPADALPCGFRGYTQRIYSNTSILPPTPVFKLKYNLPGEVIFNPPFGSSLGGDNIITSSGDNVRRTYLGFSNQVGIDESILQYKGKQNPPSAQWNRAYESIEWNWLTRGFHMDSGATTILISNSFASSGLTAFDTGVGSFSSEPDTQENPYYFLYSRKFTACFAGGFDGWDVYREYRSNQNSFKLGGASYLAGAAPSVRFPTATGQGMFKEIVINKNSVDWANTDYYAYVLGIDTFNNPESTNINVIATAGIDYVNHTSLCEHTINMVQFDRADSVYIVTTPDYQMFTPDSNNETLRILPEEALEYLEETGIDSNYTATYYPWILVRDTVNNTQIYLPPTGEVCRNLALTDNIAFPWFASAGYTRGLVNSVKARYKLTQEDRDTLYTGRINPIATFSDVGTVIWGNKTLQTADTALNRLNVRRLLLQARKLISAVAIRLLFEQNDEIVKQQFLDSVNPILDGIRRDRGLYDFRVTVSQTPEEMDRNSLSGRIFLKPTKALEFINIEFLITPTGASFEDV